MPFAYPREVSIAVANANPRAVRQATDVSSWLMRPTRLAAALMLIAISLGASPVARARPRPRFEPTDLEMEDVGLLELDVEVGFIRSRGPDRIVIPDFEVDLGILPNLELDVDGAWAIEGPAVGPFSLDHAAPDNLWLAAKVGLYDDHDEETHAGRAFGIMIGPKLPAARDAHGLGVESLLLVGASTRRVTAVFNMGGFVDPTPKAVGPRPIGLEGGIDLELRLGGGEHFQLTGELAGVRFRSAYPNQLGVSGGINWSPSPKFDLSLVALAGFLAGNDRYGVLLGFAPKLRLFGG